MAGKVLLTHIHNYYKNIRNNIYIYTLCFLHLPNLRLTISEHCVFLNNNLTRISNATQFSSMKMMRFKTI